MCDDHKWVPYLIEAVPCISVNTGCISISPGTGMFRVTEVCCVECGRVKTIAKSPYIEAQEMIVNYNGTMNTEKVRRRRV